MRIPKTGAEALEMLGVEASVHPDVELVRSESVEWVKRHDWFGGIVDEQKIRRWDFAAVVARLFPSIDLEWLKVATNLSNWISVNDDLVEADPLWIAALKPDSSNVCNEPMQAAIRRGWADIASALSFGTGETFKSRVNKELEKYFEAYAWEAPFRSTGQIPSMEEFMTMRHRSAGMPLYWLIVERACEIHNQSLARAHQFSNINRIAGNLCCWANDLLSIRWDRDHANPISLARVMASGEGRANIRNAWTIFMFEWRRLQSRELVLGDERSCELTTPEARYVYNLRNAPVGVLRWMDETRRYSV